MNDWLDLTLEQAAERLAKLAVDRRARPASYREKRAEGGGMLAGIGSYLQQNPTMAHTLLGGAVGAGGSGLMTALGNSRKNPEDRRSILQSMIGGGLGGAAIGGGLSLAGGAMHDLRHGAPNTVPHGRFTDPSTGQPMQIDAQTLREHPEIADQVRGLTAPQSPLQQGAMAGAGHLWNFARSATGLDTLSVPGTGMHAVPYYGNGSPAGGILGPISSSILPKLGLLDMLTPNRGETMGFGNVRPTHTTGPAAAEFLRRGIATVPGVEDKVRQVVGSPEKTLQEPYGPWANKPPEALPGTLNQIVGGSENGVGVPQAVMQRLDENNRPSTLMDRFRRIFGGGDVEDPAHPVLNVNHAPKTKGTMKHEDPNNKNVYRTEEFEKVMPRKNDHLSTGMARQSIEEGFHARYAKNLPGVRPNSIFRIPGIGDVHTPRWIPAIGGRALAYGAIPAAEYAVNALRDDGNRDQQLHDLMLQHARRVPQQGAPQ